MRRNSKAHACPGLDGVVHDDRRPLFCAKALDVVAEVFHRLFIRQAAFLQALQDSSLRPVPRNRIIRSIYSERFASKSAYSPQKAARSFSFRIIRAAFGAIIRKAFFAMPPDPEGGQNPLGGLCDCMRLNSSRNTERTQGQKRAPGAHSLRLLGNKRTTNHVDKTQRWEVGRNRQNTPEIGRKAQNKHQGIQRTKWLEANKCVLSRGKRTAGIMQEGANYPS